MENKFSENLDLLLQRDPNDNNPPRKIREGLNSDSIAIYIFTSGTTNLPKPCKMSHKKLIYYSLTFSNYGKMTESDKIYLTLPIYHTNGCVLPLSVWRKGGSIFLREKFSASNFFSDCKKYGCTIFMYIGKFFAFLFVFIIQLNIGELCRYLYAHPESNSDKDHSVRLMIGYNLKNPKR